MVGMQERNGGARKSSGQRSKEGTGRKEQWSRAVSIEAQEQSSKYAVVSMGG